ncbi:MAG: hypothetical protein ABIL25_08505 [candidate division WOR-3 bacterium]
MPSYLLLRYWNFVQQAARIRRQNPAGTGIDIIILHEARAQAWRALVNRYTRRGLNRQTLLVLLERVLAVRLDRPDPYLDHPHPGQ